VEREAADCHHLPAGSEPADSGPVLEQAADYPEPPVQEHNKVHSALAHFVIDL
jgi:hypothetical protein